MSVRSAFAAITSDDEVGPALEPVEVVDQALVERLDALTGLEAVVAAELDVGEV